MNAAFTPALSLHHTVEHSRLGHRLALGVQCVDAVTQLPIESGVGAGLRGGLFGVGERAVVQPLEPHSQARLALRWAGRYRQVLDRAVTQGDPVGHEVRLFGARDASRPAYASDLDPRRFVPRRLSLTPVLTDGVPPATSANVRTVWLWPGAAYPLPARSTGLRGQVQRPLGGGRVAPWPWTRLVCTRPGPGAPDLASEAVLAWGQGDERGEFVIVLGGAAVPSGGDLPTHIAVHLWVALPPLVPSWDVADPLSSLPLETGGTDALNAVLRGQVLPAGYTVQPPRPVSLRLGQLAVIPEADLLF